MPRAVQTGLLRLQPFRFLDRARAQLGPRFTVSAIAHPPLVFIADPEEARAVFAAPPDVLAPGEGGRAIAPIVGPRSFMLADGERHLQGRRRLAGLFTAQAAAGHADMVRALAEREVAGWPLGTPFALHPRLRTLTLRVILTTLFGRQLDDEPALLPHLLSMLDVAAGTALTLERTRSLPGVRGQWQRFLRERAAVDRILHRLVAARRGAHEAGEDALGTLLAARDADGAPLSDTTIRDSLMSLILAGHETTSAELAWAFQLIAHDARVQRELAGEIRSASGSRYLTATVQETLRHRTVFLFAIPRAVKAPVEIGDWTHTPPEHLLVCLYLLHHDPALFPEPQRFLPERFLGAPPGEAWLPWGGGRKLCLGWRLAFLELETVLRTALERLVVAPAAKAPERPGWRSVIVTPHAGCRVVLRRRR